MSARARLLLVGMTAACHPTPRSPGQPLQPAGPVITTDAAAGPAMPPCAHAFDPASYESTREGLACFSANSFDRCGGKAGTCGAFRVIEEDAGMVGITRYYDASGVLVGTSHLSFEYPGSKPVTEGTIPSCTIDSLTTLCPKPD